MNGCNMVCTQGKRLLKMMQPVPTLELPGGHSLVKPTKPGSVLMKCDTKTS